MTEPTDSRVAARELLKRYARANEHFNAAMGWPICIAQTVALNERAKAIVAIEDEILDLVAPTEPRTAALRDALIEAIAPVFARWVQDDGPDYDPVPELADAALATIAPDEPGRVVIDAGMKLVPKSHFCYEPALARHLYDEGTWIEIDNAVRTILAERAATGGA